MYVIQHVSKSNTPVILIVAWFISTQGIHIRVDLSPAASDNFV